jgi:S1-C subfamily serine protease
LALERREDHLMLRLNRSHRPGSRPLVLAVLVFVATIGAGAPAQAAHNRPAPPEPSSLQVLPDLLSSLLPGLFPPDGPSAVAPSVRDRVVASTVRVSGPACGRVHVGSGFSPRADTAVTAAHVVAGMTRPEVLRPDGRRLAATVVAFDPAKDLAVLRVNGLGQAPLPLGPAVVGTDGAVFGHPNGRAAVEVSPARVVAQGTVRIPNLYGQELVARQVLRLSSRLDPGDSGAPVVDQAGKVVGVAFAVAIQRPDVAFAVSSRELEPLLTQPLTSPVSTGPCVD